MPCNTRQVFITEEVKMNLDLLKKALEAMGFTVRLVGQQLNYSGRHNETGVYSSGSYINGKLSVSDSKALINPIKQSYSAQVVAKSLKPGWIMKKKSAQQQAKH